MKHIFLILILLGVFTLAIPIELKPYQETPADEEVLSEEEILHKKYLFSYKLIRHGMSKHIGLRSKRAESFTLLDTIIDQFERLNEIPLETKLLMHENIIEEVAKDSWIEPGELGFLFDHFDKYLNGKTSYLESLNMIEYFFMLQYWTNWSCNMSFAELTFLPEIDTLLLDANKTYHFPVQIHYDFESNVEILSNSLQVNRPNIISFKTPSHTNEVQSLHYTAKGFNEVTGEVIQLSDSIVYRTVDLRP